MQKLVVKSNDKVRVMITSDDRKIIVCEALKYLLMYSPELCDKLTLEILID